MMKDVTANNNKRRSQSPFGEEEGVSLKRSGFRTMQFIQVSASKDNDDPFHVSILPVKLAEAQSCPVHLQFMEFQLLDAANLGKDCLSYSFVQIELLSVPKDNDKGTKTL